MKIPYGISNFATIRSEGFFYADKTPFLPVLESGELGYRYLLFLRPRRFGKSTLLSMLEHYYDIDKRDRFDELFRGLWIHEHPTRDRSRYLVLSFDFSKLTSTGSARALEEGFCETVKASVRTFCMRYAARIPQLGALELDRYRDAASLMSNFLAIIAGTRDSLYVLVDEYDHLANRLLSRGARDLYDSMFNETGFVRSFFANLKSATTSGAVARMLVTGVTPILLDDMSSGFNVSSNVSQDPGLNTLAGFTRSEVERAVDEMLATEPAIADLPEIGERSQLLAVLEQHYNGYRFSSQATERVFNSDMVLYFLSEVQRTRAFPADMLDLNVRTEYRHLQRIGTIGGGAAVRRRHLLERVMLEGGVESGFVRQFGAASLSANAQFVSLLFYLGMLTFGPKSPESERYRLEIPNRVIRELQWQHLATMLEEEHQVVIDIDDLQAALGAMGVAGDIRPFLTLFHERVVRKMGIKDTRRLDEKALKLMMMAYLSLSRMFHLLSEKELAQGYCDLFLGASKSVPGARFSWLLELKYLPTGASPAQIEAAFAEAEKQVRRYASDQDLLPLLLGNRQLAAGVITFVGAKRVLFRPWPDGTITEVPEERGEPGRSEKSAHRRGSEMTRARGAGAPTLAKRKAVRGGTGAGRARRGP